MSKNVLYRIFEDRYTDNVNRSVYIYSDPHFGDLESYRIRHLIRVPDKKDYLNSFKDGDIFETYETHISKLIKKADEDQIRKINSTCGKGSTLIILGDVGDIECVKKLRASYKVLLLGNHDKGASNYKKEFYHDTKLLSEFPTGFIPEQQGYKIVDPTPFGNLYNKTSDNGLFDEVYSGPLMISDRIILSHEPIDPIPEYMFNIHGHVHNANYSGDDHHLNVCAEAVKYKPVNLFTLIKQGMLKDIPNIHRPTIDNATERKKKRTKIVDKK